MAKRKAMGRDPLGWIGGGGEVAEAEGPAVVAEEPTAVVMKSASDEVPDRITKEVPKFLTLEVVTARLRSDQVDFLDGLERRIMRARSRKGERITKNSLLRAAVDVLGALELDVKDIGSEDELRARVLGALEDGTE